MTTELILTKVCSKCRQEKRTECFSKMSKSNDGLQPKCRECDAAYYLLNRERVSKRVAANYANNKERYSKVGAAYYAANAQEKREYARQRHAKIKSNPEAYSKRLKLQLSSIIRFQKLHPDQVKAQRAARYAVRTGKLVRPNCCSVCNVECKPHAHHDSYDHDQRLNVRWLCAKCHSAHHRKYPDRV
jgi:hypothetical protein